MFNFLKRKGKKKNKSDKATDFNNVTSLSDLSREILEQTSSERAASRRIAKEPVELVESSPQNKKEISSRIKKPTLEVVSKPQRQIFLGSNVMSSNDGLSEAILSRLPKDFNGPVKFRSREQAVLYSQGKAEGMGVWNGKWVNLSGNGTIVFGEEHNELREDFVQAMNIRHRLIEGAFERSLHGVPLGNIPTPPATHAAHKKYDGSETNKALENYWLRGGQYMARFGAATLKNIEQFVTNIDKNPSEAYIPPIDRPNELQELMRTISGVRLPAISEQTPDSVRDVIAAVRNAQTQIAQSQQSGLTELIDTSISANRDRRGIYAHRALVEELTKEQAQQLLDNFTRISDAVKAIGSAQFKAIASESELENDVRRVAETQKFGAKDDPFAIWGPRREVAMLSNLNAALQINPPPIFVSMGVAHSENRRDVIDIIPGVTYVKGGIPDLVELGSI
ncbi:hypothetical protein [Pleionea sediminis]|uniref:hypothetical protein n=1 Tax=Pleionea sediminis TaxID=2569479 RepID=UPI00118662B8|nr:hypothetical protein [Pleionea sediminis]